MKKYSYITGKIYESTGSYTLSVKEASFDDSIVSDRPRTFRDEYVSTEEAIDDAYEIMKNIATHEGINEDDVECEEMEGGRCLVCTVPGYKEWTFCVDDNMDKSDIVKTTTNDVDVVDNDVDVVDNDVDNIYSESVAVKFGKYRSLYESDSIDNGDDDKGDDDKGDGDKGDYDKGDDDKGDYDKGDDEDGDDEDGDDEEMKAIILTVSKGDEEKCKNGLIDAGISEEDIDILDSNEDDDTVDIRIEAVAAFELKDYLLGKGIDLEEEIGGEIVSDDEDGDDEDGDDENGDDENGDDDFDFKNIEDIFGDEKEE